MKIGLFQLITAFTILALILALVGTLLKINKWEKLGNYLVGVANTTAVLILWLLYWWANDYTELAFLK